MERNRKWGLGLSLGFHISIGIGLWISSSPIPVPTPPVPLVTFLESRQEGLSIQTSNSKTKKVRSKTKRSESNRKNTNQPSGRSQGGKGQGFRYGDYSPAPFHTGTFENHQQAHESGWAGNEVMETMNGMGLSEYSENFYFFEALVGHINQMVPYPKELWEHKISGKIWIKIQIDRQGRLLRVIETSQNAPVLMAFVLVNLYQALKDPLPQRYWYSQEKDLALILSFDFSVSSVPSMPETQTARYFKNRFEFARVAKVPNFIEETMQDYARYIPPIAPTPMGPIVNFVQVYNMIQAWRGDDPLVKKRNREFFTRERMQKLLEKTQKQHYPANAVE